VRRRGLDGSALDREAPPRWLSVVGVSLPLIVGLAVYAEVLALPQRVLDGPGPYLHVAVGRWILAHGTVPDRDPFSHSMPGAPWVPHEWLAQVISAALHDTMGWAGLVIATALCFGVTLALLTRVLLAYLAPSHALIAVIGAWGLCYPHLVARPHIPGLLLLVVWIALLVVARARDQAPPYPVAALMTLWANLHGGFMFGLGFAALFGAEAVLLAPDVAVRRRAARDWIAFVAVSALAALITPNGVSGFLFPLRLMRMDFVLATVPEWQSPNFQHLEPLEYWLLLALLGAFTLGVRLPVTRVAMLLLLVHMSLAHGRHAELLGLVGPLVIAPALAAQIKPYRLLFDRRWGALAKPARAPALALAAVVALGAAVAVWRVGVAHDSGRLAPTAAIAAAAQQHVEGPVFNDYGFGNYLIYAGIAPFIDGRADMYGDDFLRRSRNLAALPALLAEYRIGWTLLRPENPHVALLDHLAGWRRLYTDKVAVVHVRDAAP